MSRLRLSALLTLCVPAAAAGPVGAQQWPQGTPPPPPRDRPDGATQLPPPGPTGRQLRPDLLRQIEQPEEPTVPDFRKWLLGLNKKSLPKEINSDVLKDLLKRMEKLPKDQRADEKEIQELLRENPKFKDPAFLNQLKKIVTEGDFRENLQQKFPKGDVPIPNNDEHLKQNLEQVIDQGKSNPVIPDGGPKGGPAEGPKVHPPDLDPGNLNPKTPSPAAENEWAKWLDKNFGDSPAGQAAFKDLVSALEKQDTQGMFDKLPEFKSGAFKDFDSAFGKQNTGDLWKLKPPDLSGNKMTPPRMGGNSGGSSIGDGGGGSGLGGGGTSVSGGGTALAVMVGIAGAILLAALLFRNWKLNEAERAAGAAAGKPGIDFDAIRTREDLVRAFDHVSLDQMGEEARAWNHRVVADQIAAARPAQAEPADEVAGLYERARYAPRDEDLSAGEFADARRDLRAIAGVPA